MRIRSLLLGLALGAAFFLAVPVIFLDLWILNIRGNEWYSLPFLAAFVLLCSLLFKHYLDGIAVGLASSLLVLWATTVSHPSMGLISAATVLIFSLPVWAAKRQSGRIKNACAD